jgi:lysophospholipid acyltransferase (LPLAT)-like uncharacterized protein
MSMIRARVLGRIAWVLVQLVNWSVRVCFVNRESADRFASVTNNGIYVFYHGDMVPLLTAYRNSGILIPASESRDGEIMARLLKNFGFDVVRGSSKRKGQKALREMIAGMRRGKTVAISVDGPRGPLHEVKPGAVYLAGLMKRPIIPLAVSAKKYYIIENSWDQLLIPAPFTEAVVVYGDPVYVDGTSDKEISAAQRALETSLHGLKSQAESAYQNGHTGLSSLETEMNERN